MCYFEINMMQLRFKKRFLSMYIIFVSVIYIYFEQLIFTWFNSLGFKVD